MTLHKEILKQNKIKIKNIENNKYFFYTKDDVNKAKKALEAKFDIKVNLDDFSIITTSKASKASKASKKFNLKKTNEETTSGDVAVSEPPIKATKGKKKPKSLSVFKDLFKRIV